MVQLFFFGASITQGVGDAEGGWVDRLKRDLHQRMYGSNPEGERYGVFNLGIAGDTSAMVLQRMQTEIERRTRPQTPSVFVVSVGTNDSRAKGQADRYVATSEQYERTLQAIIDRAGNYGGKLLLVGLPPNDDTRTQPIRTTYFSQERIGQFDAVMTKVARHNKLSKVEIFEPMLREDWRTLLFKDGLHPNAAGHAFIADRVKPELWKLLGLE